MKKIFLVLPFLAVMSFSCGQGESSSNASKSSSDRVATLSDSVRLNQSRNATTAANTGDGDGGGGGGGREDVSSEVLAQTKPIAQTISLNQTESVQNAPTSIERKIVRNAELNLESQSPEMTQRKIVAIAESLGGFVVESEKSSTDVKITTRDVVTMSVRVPSAKFGEAVDEIRNTADRVVKETVKGDDVTEEFIDVEARLKAKKALEEQFMEIMKRANSVEDALNVQSELADVRSEIERIEGRKRFLENQSSLSTIKIRVQTPAAFSASSTGFGYRLSESLGSGFDFALNFILGLVTFVIALLPFAIFIGLPGYLVGRYFWRKRTGPKSVSIVAEDEIS